MKQVKILIYSENKTYGERLFWLFHRQKNQALEFYLATSREGFMKTLEKTKMDGVLLDYDLKGEFTDLPRCFWLVPGEARAPDEISMCQKGTEVFREVLNRYEVPEHSEEMPQIICVFSPEGMRDKTEFALGLAADSLERGRVVYLSLAGFPVLFGDELEKLPQLTEEGLTHLVFDLSEKNFEENLERCIFSYEGFDVVMPFWHYKDLLDVEFADLERLITLLIQKAGYHTIIIEMEQLFEYTFQVMELADQIMIPMTDSVFDQIRLNVLRGYCKLDHKEELASRFQVIIEDREDYDIYDEV